MFCYAGEILSLFLRQATTSQFPSPVGRESGIISKEMPRFLELNQKVLEIFLVLANPQGFSCRSAVGSQGSADLGCLFEMAPPRLQERSPPHAVGVCGSGQAPNSEMQHIHNRPRLCEAEKEQGV